MLKNILKKDLARNKLITAILFLFILLASLSASVAASLFCELQSSVDTFLARAKAPHFLQMSSEEPDRATLGTFTADAGFVQEQQTCELLTVSGAEIYLGEKGESLAGSVLENSFTVQSGEFDFLLDQNNEIMQVGPGEIGLPIYYMKQYRLKSGDKIAVRKDGFLLEFTVKGFLRDVQMNSSLVTSKRLLVHEKDLIVLKQHTGKTEYLIEFLLNDPGRTEEFESLYQASALPQEGTAVTFYLFRLLNALSDGIVAAVILLISFTLLTISFVSLRFVFLSAIEEDYREIGTMKAIGIRDSQIRLLYLGKYVLLSGAACLGGCLLSLLFSEPLTRNITLYMGSSGQTTARLLPPFVGSALIFLLVICFCDGVLYKFRKISAVDALRDGCLQDARKIRHPMKLSRTRLTDVNLFLSWNDILMKFHSYCLLSFVFLLCMLLISAPRSFLNTLRSPDFITYMGAGKSDLRMDLSRDGTAAEDLDRLIRQIKADPDTESYAVFSTGSYRIQKADGQTETLKIENGDFSSFPLQYTDGRAPKDRREIALSALNAEAFYKRPGDTITVLSENQEYHLTVCGIYQDITNGGRTAKAMLPVEQEEALWHIVNLNLAKDADVPQKMQRYAADFPSVKVTDMEDYVYQTFGSVIGGLKAAAAAAVLLSLTVALLITALFFKMLITKERVLIASLLSMGFSTADIRLQYRIRALTAAAAGILAGTIAAVTLGPRMAGLFLAGAAHIRFLANPFATYILYPLLLFLCAWAAVTVSIAPVGNVSAADLQNRRPLSWQI